MDPVSALDWLGARCDVGLLAELDALSTRPVPGLDGLIRLRGYLDGAVAAPTLATAAKALGTSARSLQRELLESETSFQTERNAAQIRRAKRLLRETSFDLKRIAIEVGCASAPAFTVLFRRLVGQSPSQWRAGLATGDGPRPSRKTS
jgi:AraC-like DNA-binding protein